MITFKYYDDCYLDQIEAFILSSYQYDFPLWGLSRHEFSRGLHPDFKNCHQAWTESMGLFFEDDQLISCVLSEGSYEGDAFLLFDSLKRTQDKMLIEKMVRFAITHLSKKDDNQTTHHLYINVPNWHQELKDVLINFGFECQANEEKVNILHFNPEPYQVVLPKGFQFSEQVVKPFYLSTIHRHAFNYELPYAEQASKAFSNLRTMKNYDPDLEVVILDQDQRPVGFAIGWMHDKMPYAELEPMGVVWWCRRLGLASALIHELANRIKAKYPHAYGMTGGDQPFYEAIGFKTATKVPVYLFKKDIYKSWDPKSLSEDYKL